MKTNSIMSPENINRYTFGDFTITSLTDGTLNLPLANIIPDNSNFDSPLFHAKPDAMQITPINIFLIDTGSQKILVDTGLAHRYNTPSGLLMNSLINAGYQPEQITAILITHLHPDHISGLLTPDGKQAFIHAELYINNDEINYWTGDQVAQEHQSLSTLIKTLIKPYTIKTFTPGQTIFDGISAFASQGHTPGHVGFLCTSKNKNVLVWGDIIHFPTVQFAHPEISLRDDSNYLQAIQTRKSILHVAVQQSYVIAGVHLPSPGLGTITQIADESYQWNPL